MLARRFSTLAAASLTAALGCALTAAFTSAVVPVAHAQDGDSGGPTSIRVVRLDDATIEAAALVGIADGAFRMTTGDETQAIPITDVVAVLFPTRPDATAAPPAALLAIDLWSGEEIRGVITKGDDRTVTVRTDLMGTVTVELDAIAGLRSPARLASVEDPPDLAPPTDQDAIHLTGGDRVDCTVTEIRADGIRCNTSARDGVMIAMDRVTALRLVQYELEEPPALRFSVVLRDGSRVLGTDPAVADARLRLSSVSGFVVEPALKDIVALHAMTSAFDYIADLDAEETVVEPFWEPVAGDAAKLYAPRRDRAFSGSLLTVGGRTWVKGLGVYAGTSMTWRLDGNYAAFRSEVGVDDAAGRLGGVVFEVLVDGVRRWKSPYVRATSSVDEDHGEAGPVSTGSIDVSGAETITLRVLPGDDEAPYPIQDQADWLGAMLVK